MYHGFTPVSKKKLLGKICSTKCSLRFTKATTKLSDIVISKFLLACANTQRQEKSPICLENFLGEPVQEEEEEESQAAN
jgi:hypothetical protein